MGFLSAAAQTPADKNALLKQLDQIESKQKDAQMGSLNDVLAQVTGAMSYTDAALKLYQKAVFTVRFDGAKGDQSEYAKWMKDKEDTFHDPLFTKALSLHLQFLALTLQAVKEEDPAKLSAGALDFVRAYWDFAPLRVDGGKSGKDAKNFKEPEEIGRLLDQGVGSGAIAKYCQVDTLVPTVKDWADTPSHYGEILSKAVFPSLRTAKSPSLIVIWDEYIGYETDTAEKNPLADQRTHFENEDLPKLRWKRAQDLVAIDRAEEGMSQMFEIIRAFPLHPDNPAWITELRGVVQAMPDKGDKK